MSESQFSRDHRDVMEGLQRGLFKMREQVMSTWEDVQGKPHDTTRETIALFEAAIAVLERCREP